MLSLNTCSMWIEFKQTKGTQLGALFEGIKIAQWICNACGSRGCGRPTASLLTRFIPSLACVPSQRSPEDLRSARSQQSDHGWSTASWVAPPCTKELSVFWCPCPCPCLCLCTWIYVQRPLQEWDTASIDRSDQLLRLSKLIASDHSRLCRFLVGACVRVCAAFTRRLVACACSPARSIGGAQETDCADSSEIGPCGASQAIDLQDDTPRARGGVV